MMDSAVEEFFDAELVWYSEMDKHCNTILESRYPGVPNVGNLKEIDWASLPPIDLLTGGYPCQPFSTAGKRLGEDDPRHLWPYIREGIRIIRPRITLLENVDGHRSKGFNQVLEDCAEDGLDARWVSIRASAVGATHQRWRLYFALAHPDDFAAWHRLESRHSAGGDTEQPAQRPGEVATDSSHDRFPRGG